MKSDIDIIDFFQIHRQTRINIPLFLNTVKAGFPSPADDYIESKIDFNDYLIKHPAATFCVRVSGDSMINASINNGDILIVDRSITPSSNKIIVAIVNGEFTIKRFVKLYGRLFLLPDNPAYKPIEILPEIDFEIWGVVTHVIHDF